MALTQKHPIFSKESYLDFERNQDNRHEFLDGNVYAMASESLDHSKICFNLYGYIHQKLRGKSCSRFSPNMKIATNNEGLFSYPDLAVVCGEPAFLDDRKDINKNPRVIFEVLSPWIPNYDRREKFFRYTNYLETLHDYILISQDEPIVEHFTKQENGGWESIEIRGLDAILEIESIECEISLSELYEEIDFSNS